MIAALLFVFWMLIVFCVLAILGSHRGPDNSNCTGDCYQGRECTCKEVKK